MALPGQEKMKPPVTLNKKDLNTFLLSTNYTKKRATILNVITNGSWTGIITVLKKKFLLLFLIICLVVRL